MSACLRNGTSVLEATIRVGNYVNLRLLARRLSNTNDTIISHLQKESL